ncbi:MAG: ATP-binding protein, partial [bacterium]|nr:ATP-binding protein [bacterium]
MTKFWSRVADRLDRIGSAQVQGYFQDLCRETALLWSILQSVSEGIVVVDREGRIRFLNDAAREILGVSQKNPVSKPLLRNIADPSLFGLFETSLRDRSLVIDKEVEVRHPKQMAVRVNVLPYRLDEGQPPGTIVILRDVTAERSRQLESFQSEKLEALVTLAAGVAHEIGNPLNSLSIHMQLMEREVQRLQKKNRLQARTPALRDLQRLSDTLEIAKSEVRRLDDTVRRFLGAIRPSQLRHREANINNLVESVLDFMYFEISQQDIAIEKEYDRRIPLIMVDEDQIKQAFFNIIKNAIQAMPAGGVLRTTTRLRDSQVEVTFSDTGVGVPKEKINRVFEPFYTTKEGGSGLGLMMVYRIIKDHAGTLTFTSEEGKGTKVTVSLPLHGKETR